MSNKEGVVVLGFGPQPIDFITKASKICGETAVMCPTTARMAGANRAAGTEGALSALRERLEAGTLAVALEEHGDKLSTNAIAWLASGQRGLSSNTLFTFTTGVNAKDDDWHNYPLDPADLRRCRLLLDQCPELVSKLPAVAAAGPEWAALVARWDEVCGLMDKETPDWREGNGAATQTYKLMKSIFAGARAK